MRFVAFDAVFADVMVWVDAVGHIILQKIQDSNAFIANPKINKIIKNAAMINQSLKLNS